MVLDEPAHRALSVMTLIALAGPRGPRTAPEIAAQLELPAAGINRALRDLAAARLLRVELEAARIGYAATRPPSTVTIAEIIEAAHVPRSGSFGPTSADDVNAQYAAGRRLGRHTGSRRLNPAERARQGLMSALAQITLSDVLNAQVRRAEF